MAGTCPGHPRLLRKKIEILRGATMNKPLSDPPLKADDLDLVELVMEVEERLGVAIQDDQVEKLSGKLGKGPIRMTPIQIVRRPTIFLGT